MNNPVILDPMIRTDSIMSYLNTNKYMISLAAVFVILGSRDLIIEMNSQCKSVFKRAFIKKIVLFSSMFLYTRDIFSAINVSIIIMCIFNDIFFKETDFVVDKNKLKCW